MRKKKQVEVGNTTDRPRRGATPSARHLLPVLNIPADPQLASAGDRPLPQEPDAPVAEGFKAFCSIELDVPPTFRSHDPEFKLNPVVKVSLDYLSKLQKGQHVCNAIDAEVKSRSAVIRALGAAEYSSFMAETDLFMSKYSAEQQDMPLEECLKSCPRMKSVVDANGRMQLQKRSSPYPTLEESKRNLQDTLTKAKDRTSKAHYMFTPCSEPKFSATQLYTSEQEKQESEQQVVGDELSWPEYYSRLQNTGYAGLTASLGSHNKMVTPMIRNGGFGAYGVTPKTVRLPKQGETMLSINGSPLGQFGKTPRVSGSSSITRRTSRLGSSKKSLREL